MIRDGETGFLATTPDEWVAAIDAAGARLRGDGSKWACWLANVSRRITRSSAWAETFVTSMTGTCRSRRRDFLENRSVCADKRGLRD